MKSNDRIKFGLSERHNSKIARGAVHLRENVKACGFLPVLSRMCRRTVWIDLMLPISLRAAPSAADGLIMLPSLPSSQRPSTSQWFRPSDSETLQTGLSPVLALARISLRSRHSTPGRPAWCPFLASFENASSARMRFFSLSDEFGQSLIQGLRPFVLHVPNGQGGSLRAEVSFCAGEVHFVLLDESFFVAQD